MSVKELVKQKKEQLKLELEKKRKIEEELENDKFNRAYDEEINFLIRTFELSMFDINSTEEKVADVIVHKNDKILFGENIEFNYITTFHGGSNKKPIRESEKFIEWKKNLEDKFGISIEFKEEYKPTDDPDNHKSRYGFRFETYKGIKVSITV